MKKALISWAVVTMIAACRNSIGSNKVEVEIDPDEMLIVNEDDFSTFEVTPEVYAIAASRATNQMLAGSEDLYRYKEPKPKLFIAPIKKLKERLPDGFHFARKTTEQIIEGSGNYMVVLNEDEADYKLIAEVDAVPNPEMRSPVIDYRLRLLDIHDVNLEKSADEQNKEKDSVESSVELNDDNAEKEVVVDKQEKSDETNKPNEENKQQLENAEEKSEVQDKDVVKNDKDSSKKEKEKINQEKGKEVGFWMATMKQLKDGDNSWW